MNNQLKAFFCQNSYPSYEQDVTELIVLAYTPESAIQLAMKERPDRHATPWEVKEIPLTGGEQMIYETA